METETIELICDECRRTYLFDHIKLSRDLVGSHYCPECFDRLMGRYK